MGEMSGTEPRDSARPLPDRVTMPLLTLITQQSMDEDYLHAAERRAAGAPGPPPGRPRRTAAVVVAVFGIMATTAFVQTSRNATVDDAGRATLVQQIVSRRADVAEMQQQIVDLRQRNVGLEDQLAQLTRTEQAAVARMRRMEVNTGFVPVKGEGVRIVTSDTPDGDATQVIRDEDLALLVDGLWHAGAEAISINGQRLTALSGIRNVDVVIHVNSRPLSPPYTVLAVGDTRDLQAGLLDSTHGQQWFSLVNQLGFEFEMQNEDALELPAASDKMLRLRKVRTGTSAEAESKITEGGRP